MRIDLGVKSDPIEYRYSPAWFFDLLAGLGVRYVQFGSFTELYALPDAYFEELRQEADAHDIRIKSVFTAHRELGGLLTGDERLAAVARRNHQRLLEVAALLGADYCGSNPGAVYRDRQDEKVPGMVRWLDHARELMHQGRELGLAGLSLEPMSCAAEPPTTPEEIRSVMDALAGYHADHPHTTVPFYLCSDMAHGYADAHGRVVHDNLELFAFNIPWTCEFHIKNTDSSFDATFGFTPQEVRKGIVDLREVAALIRRHAHRLPVADLVGYLEIPGPKLGRDYSDHLLAEQITESVAHIRRELGDLLPD